MLSTIPSPTQGVWHLGPVPVRAYALCIVAGIVFAVWLSERRWVARGGVAGQVGDIAIFAVPFGVVGGRLYHVITSPQAYFGEGGRPLDALKVWQGGLGVWGAVALGAVGAWIGCRRAGISLASMADACAPGIVAAQGIGRLGNWFNNELYGGPTDLPWRLKIYQWDLGAGRARTDASGEPLPLSAADGGFYRHPTFLYELLWDIGVAVLLIWADRRFRIGYGRLFALYVMAYTAGRVWIEALRTDPANHILGVRLNVWTSVLVFAGAAIAYAISQRRHPGRESDGAPAAAADADVAVVSPAGVTVGDSSTLDGTTPAPARDPE
ncbi:MAG: prolipoprotein diacylglyceryl transferase [Kineosporiaceae bacterium]